MADRSRCIGLLSCDPEQMDRYGIAFSSDCLEDQRQRVVAVQRNHTTSGQVWLALATVQSQHVAVAMAVVA